MVVRLKILVCHFLYNPRDRILIVIYVQYQSTRVSTITFWAENNSRKHNLSKTNFSMEDRSMCGEGLHKLTGSLTLQTHPAKNAGSPPQVMRLDLGLDIREDLLKELRKPVHISFGKIIVSHLY